MDAKRAGRVIAALVFGQMAGSAVFNGVLVQPIVGEPGYLAGGAPHAQQVGAAAFVLVATECVALAVASTLFAFVWPRSRTNAVALVGLAAVVASAGILEAAQMMTLVSASTAWVRGGPERETIEAMRTVVGGARNWAHYLGRIMDGLMGLAVATTLFRFQLVPRAIAGLAMLAAPLMLASLARPFFGGAVNFTMLAPVGIAQLVLVVWLMVKGLRDAPATG